MKNAQFKIFRMAVALTIVIGSLNFRLEASSYNKLDLWPSDPIVLAMADRIDFARGSDVAPSDEGADITRMFEKRSKAIQTHKWIGWGAVALAALALGTASGAGGDSSSDRNKHANLGYAAGAIYATSGIFALTAPKVGGPRTLGGKIHKGLAWIHFPAMALALISGYQAKKQKDNGEGIHGLADHHVAAASVAVATFYSAVLVVYF